MTKKVIETVNGWYMENPKQKVELDDIVGLVKTDEPTDSVQLKKEAQLSIYEKRIIELENENEKLKQFKENVLVLLEEKVKHYEHKPFSIPAMQPLSLNFDGDMDRISRLSELQDLKRVIEQGVEKGYKKRNGG